jgi:hypothetical protein
MTTLKSATYAILIISVVITVSYVISILYRFDFINIAGLGGTLGILTMALLQYLKRRPETDDQDLVIELHGELGDDITTKHFESIISSVMDEDIASVKVKTLTISNTSASQSENETTTVTTSNKRVPYDFSQEKTYEFIGESLVAEVIKIQFPDDPGPILVVWISTDRSIAQFPMFITEKNINQAISQIRTLTEQADGRFNIEGAILEGMVESQNINVDIIYEFEQIGVDRLYLDDLSDRKTPVAERATKAWVTSAREHTLIGSTPISRKDTIDIQYSVAMWSRLFNTVVPIFREQPSEKEAQKRYRRMKIPVICIAEGDKRRSENRVISTRCNLHPIDVKS